MSQNIQNGNKMALDGYNRAYEKKLVLGNPQSPLFNKEPFDYAEKIFLAIANDTKTHLKISIKINLHKLDKFKKISKKSLQK